MKHRRTISMNPRAYLQLRKVAEAADVSMSAMVESLIASEAASACIGVTDDEVDAAKRDYVATRQMRRELGR